MLVKLEVTSNEAVTVIVVEAATRTTGVSPFPGVQLIALDARTTKFFISSTDQTFANPRDGNRDDMRRRAYLHEDEVIVEVIILVIIGAGAVWVEVTPVTVFVIGVSISIRTPQVTAVA